MAARYFTIRDLMARWGNSEQDVATYIRTGALAAVCYSPSNKKLGTFAELQEGQRVVGNPNTDGVLLTRTDDPEKYLPCSLRIPRNECERFEREHGGIGALGQHFECGTLIEAAAAIAKKEGWHNGARDTLLKQLIAAASAEELIVRDPHTDLPYRPARVLGCELVFKHDLNAYLQQSGVSYRIGGEGMGLRASAEHKTENVHATDDWRNDSSMAKSAKQRRAIAETIALKQWDPMAVPDGEKGTIETLCRDGYPELFEKETSFYNAWKSGLKVDAWRMQSHSSYAKRSRG